MNGNEFVNANVNAVVVAAVVEVPGSSRGTQPEPVCHTIEDCQQQAAKIVNQSAIAVAAAPAPREESSAPCAFRPDSARSGGRADRAGRKRTGRRDRPWRPMSDETVPDKRIRLEE